MAALLPVLTPRQPPFAAHSLSRVVMAGACLLGLAGLSYGVSFLQLGRFNLPVALAIAVCKALTVLFVFMDFGSLSASGKLAAGAALLMVALLIGLMVADVATREQAPLSPPKPLSEGRAQYAPLPSSPGAEPARGRLGPRVRPSCAAEWHCLCLS